MRLNFYIQTYTNNVVRHSKASDIIANIYVLISLFRGIGCLFNSSICKSGKRRWGKVQIATKPQKEKGIWIAQSKQPLKGLAQIVFPTCPYFYGCVSLFVTLKIMNDVLLLLMRAEII